MSTNLSIVVPCFNEEAVLPLTIGRLEELLSRLVTAGVASADSRVVLVDDGSLDGTWNLIVRAVRAGKPVVGVKLSRNRGHQNALIAGLEAADGDAIVSMDADLQDDVFAIKDMLAKYEGGAEVVLGVRSNRQSDGLFKRLSASLFYRLLRVMGAETVQNHADFRLLSRRALDALLQFREVNLYLRGTIPLLGFKTAVVPYTRAARAAGESKYPLPRMISLSLEAVTSFSVVPLRAISVLGFVVSSIAAALGLWVIAGVALVGGTVPGWASTVLPIYFLGGVQLLGMGVIGEYVGKIYLEAKGRPRYIVEEICRAAEGQATCDRTVAGSGLASRPSSP